MTLEASQRHNVAHQLVEVAHERPDQPAVVVQRVAYQRSCTYDHLTFSQVLEDAVALAAGLSSRGVPPGARLVLMVPPGREFVTIVFALLAAGYVPVLVDPGLGWRRMVRCLARIEPDGLIGVPLAHWAFFATRWASRMKYRVAVGKGWVCRGWRLDRLHVRPIRIDVAPVLPETPAAIIFTSGSTGPPKGVLYYHRHFASQIRMLREAYGIRPGEVDLATFPLFGLFNGALGVTTVFPRMNFTRPASVRAERILAACRDWNVTQAFGSPALWTRVARHCETTGEKLHGLQRVFSAGAPVPPRLLERLRNITSPDTQIFTPYGATEALPIASIEARQVLESDIGSAGASAGYCVGTPLPGIEVRVIAIDDGPLPNLHQATVLARGQVGEIVVSGSVVTERYVADELANKLHKMQDGDRLWHRTGDVGYLDDEGRIWYCGRKSQRVQTSEGTLFTEPCEAVLARHRAVYRCALVGVGEPPEQIAVLVVETWPEAWPRSPAECQRLEQELKQLLAQDAATRSIQHILFKRSLPVDIRHNAKIFREKLVPWVSSQLKRHAL